MLELQLCFVYHSMVSLVVGKSRTPLQKQSCSKIYIFKLWYLSCMDAGFYAGFVSLWPDIPQSLWEQKDLCGSHWTVLTYFVLSPQTQVSSAAH